MNIYFQVITTETVKVPEEIQDAVKEGFISGKLKSSQDIYDNYTHDDLSHSIDHDTFQVDPVKGGDTTIDIEVNNEIVWDNQINSDS